MAFDAASAAHANSVSSLSWSHTCTGSNLKLAAMCGQRVEANAINAFTYNSVGLSIVGSRVADGNLCLDLYQLSSPATGTNTVAITLSATATRIGGAAQSLTGRDTGAATDANGGSAGSATSGSTSITTVAAGCDIVDFLWRRNDFEANVGTGQTQPAPFPYDAGTTNTIAGSYVANKSPAGAETMDWSWTNSHSWTHKTCSFAPAATATVPLRTLMGAGL